MSALQTLPPDQRAVLQLILKQGRGYADLSGLLKIDEAAVRARALAGLETLGEGSGQALSPQRRAQVADYLLGQQSGADLDATRTYLDDSAAARRWATALRAQLAPVARDPLPEIPAASTNGHAVADATAPADEAGSLDPRTAEPDATAEHASVGPFDDGDDALDDAPPAVPAAASRDPRGERSGAPAFRPRPDEPGPDGPRRSSKVGGIVLIVGVAVLIAVLAIVLIGGGDDEPSSSATPAATQSATGADGQTTGEDGGGATAPQVLAQVNLNATAPGSDAAGIGWVQRVDGRPMIAVQVARIAPNGEQDVYAAWLRATNGSARFLGFVPSQVGRDRTFTVSASLPGDVSRYDEVIVTRETITSAERPTRPQAVVLSGPLRLRG
jgi:hypothetical protein